MVIYNHLAVYISQIENQKNISYSLYNSTISIWSGIIIKKYMEFKI